MQKSFLRSAPGARPWLGVAALVALLAATWIVGVRSPERAPRDERPLRTSAAPASDPSGAPPPAHAAPAPAPRVAAAGTSSAPAARSVQPPPPLAAVRDAGARGAAAALLEDAREARRQGDLRRQLALLEAAVERTPAVETHAALGTLYLELGASRRAEKNLRAAAEGDPQNADRWIALANALALKPDPFAAAEAVEQARAAEPRIEIIRDAGGRLLRRPASSP